ncbi:UNVERIFIED_CONTAM: RHS repeat-associated protein [Acetivibrio alkalicellulosi]
MAIKKRKGVGQRLKISKEEQAKFKEQIKNVKKNIQSNKNSKVINNDLVETSGDPINVVSGSFLLDSTDLLIEDRCVEVSIKRSYVSNQDEIGLMGMGWFFEFESNVKVKDGQVTVTYPDGHINIFKKADSGYENQINDDQSDVLTDDLQTGGYTLQCKKDRKTFQYDKRGKIKSIIDRNGNTIDVRYNHNGEIDSIVSPGGKKLSFECQSGKIIKITDNIGRKVLYKYEGDNLKEVTLPNGGTVKYTYEQGFITSVTDQNGVTYVKNEYDEAGKVVKQYDADGNLTEINYDEDNKENTFIYHATGVVERHKYNEASLFAGRIYSDGTSETIEYDECWNKYSEIDRSGREIKRRYNNKGDLLEERYPDNTFVENTYDQAGNLIKTVTSGGTENLYSYDKKGNLLEEKLKTEEGQYSVTKYTYDLYGRILTRTDANNNTTNFEYNENHINKPTKVIDPEGNVFEYTYDKVGRMTSIATSYGKVQFEYNSINKKTKIIDPLGNITHMEYDMMGNLIKKVLPKGHEYAYQYDSMDRLIETIDPMNNVFSLKYDIHGNLIKEVNPNYYDQNTGDGTGVSYQYDESNRKIKTIYPESGEAKVVYDPAGNIIKTIEAGKESGTSYSYDEMNRLTGIIDAEGNKVKEFEYDEDGRLIKELNAKGYATLYKYNLAGWVLEKRIPVEEKSGMVFYNITKYTYDLAGRKIEEKVSRDYVDEESYPKEWNIISYTYDKNNRIIKISDTLGAQVEYAYDCLGNKTFEKIKINDKKNKIIRYRYNSLGWLEKTSEEIDGEDLKENLEGKAIAQTVYQYDKNGNIKKITLPEGSETSVEYDKSDRIAKVKRIGGKEGIRTTAYEYDSAGNVIKEIDCNGNSIKYEYDSMNRRIRITDKEGGITRLFYDDSGNVIKQVTPQNYNAETDDGEGTTYTYDNLNRLIEITNALGVVVQKNIYNNAGELVEKVDASQKGMEYKYDIGGRIIEILTPGAKKKGMPAQKYTYDAQGNITGIVDGEGNTTNHTLDLWGRIQEITKADGSIEKYSYDYAGNITSSTDGNGNTTEYKYNSLNKVSQIIDQAGAAISYKYDIKGRVSRKIDRNKRVTDFLYNMDDNLLLRKDLATGALEEFNYNVDGTLKAASSGGMTYSYEYTPGMKLKSKKANGKPILKYKYDKNSNIVELDDVAGRQIQYKYDIIGRMEEVYAGGKREASYGYNDDGTISSINFGNGIKVEYSHDEEKNLIGIHAVNGEGIEILNHSYVYDNNGNQVEKVENGEVTKYFYDNLNRLSKAVYPSAEEVFTYDMAGNRRARTIGSITTSYDYDSRNRLREKIEGGEHTSYQYDAQGNLIAENGMRGTTKYTYDCFNRTLKVQSATGGYVKNRYDPEGLRFEVNENGSLNRFIFSGRDVVAELDGVGNLKASIVRGHELLAQKDDKGNSHYYLNNGHGDVVGLADGKGEVVNSYRYDAFGNIVEAKEQVHNRFKYAGEQFDQVTGQYYLRARFYNPVVGRFTQEDTYRGDGLNLYSYVSNNPVKYVDPSGYCGESKSNVYEKGYRPKAGERSMTREQWKEQSRQQRLDSRNGRGDSITSPSLDDPRTGVRLHIEEFRDGGSFITSTDTYNKFIKNSKLMGYPDNTMYIARKDYMDKIFNEANGDLSVLEKRLGFDNGYFAGGGGLVRIDIKSPLLHNARMPSGMEMGANKYFKWGGYTSGGVPEAVVNRVPNNDGFRTVTFFDW